MKEYDIKVIVDRDKFNILFECDKEKNKECNKHNCNGYCNYTTDSRYMKAKARQHNNNITDQEIIINLEKEIEYYRNKLQKIKDNKILIDKPIKALFYEETTLYADNKVIQTTINYKYEQ